LSREDVVASLRQDERSSDESSATSPWPTSEYHSKHSRFHL
jgi:hypothetical protein